MFILVPFWLCCLILFENYINLLGISCWQIGEWILYSGPTSGVLLNYFTIYIRSFIPSRPDRTLWSYCCCCPFFQCQHLRHWKHMHACMAPMNSFMPNTPYSDIQFGLPGLGIHSSTCQSTSIGKLNINALDSAWVPENWIFICCVHVCVLVGGYGVCAGVRVVHSCQATLTEHYY